MDRSTGVAVVRFGPDDGLNLASLLGLCMLFFLDATFESSLLRVDLSHDEFLRISVTSDNTIPGLDKATEGLTPLSGWDN